MELSVQRAWLLRIIYDYPNISVSELSRRSGIANGTTIFRHLQDLKSRGLIEMDKKEKKVKTQPMYLKATKKANPLDWIIFKAIGYNLEQAKSNSSKKPN